jgi:hypothetical protein
MRVKERPSFRWTRGPRASSRFFGGVRSWGRGRVPTNSQPLRDRIGSAPEERIAKVSCWPGTGAAPVSRGVCLRGDVVDRRGPRRATPASAIEASSHVPAAKLGGSKCRRSDIGFGSIKAHHSLHQGRRLTACRWVGAGAPSASGIRSSTCSATTGPMGSAARNEESPSRCQMVSSSSR